MANLHFHYGVMGAAKTAQLLTTAFNLMQTGICQMLLNRSEHDDKLKTPHTAVF